MKWIAAAIVAASLIIASAIVLTRPEVPPETRQVDTLVYQILLAKGWSCDVLELGSSETSGHGYWPAKYLCTAPT